MENNKEIIKASKASMYHERNLKGLTHMTIEGTLETRGDQWDSCLYLINRIGEINLDDALRIGAEHGAEVSISFTFKTPVDIAGTESSDT